MSNAKNKTKHRIDALGEKQLGVVMMLRMIVVVLVIVVVR